jgi:hypothetical protein
MLQARTRSGSAPGAAAREVHSAWISSTIQPALERSTTGRVLHVFDSAAYLTNQAGDVLAIVSEEVGPGPLSVVLAGVRHSVFEALHPGEPARFTTGSILSNRLTIRLDGRRWEACPSWDSLRAGRELLRACLPEMREILVACAPAGSLASLLGPPPSRPSMTSTIRFVDEAAARSDVFLAALGAALRHGPGPIPSALGDLRRAAGDLAGLGGGFTPAGDDFLVGAIYALFSWMPSPIAQLVSAEIAAAAAPRTTSVSAAYLRAAAGGAAGPRWHRLVDSVIRCNNPERRLAVRLLAQVGHTSGADALAGFLLALRTGLAIDP